MDHGVQARMQIIEAARICNDLVARRLEQVDHELFVYHMNNNPIQSNPMSSDGRRNSSMPASQIHTQIQIGSSGQVSIKIIKNFLVRPILI